MSELADLINRLRDWPVTGRGDGFDSTVIRNLMLDAADALTAAQSSAPADDGWRDIASAPKEDDAISFFYEPRERHQARSFYVGRWSAYHSRWVDIDSQFRKPTHWQPLPAPPAQTAS